MSLAYGPRVNVSGHGLEKPDVKTGNCGDNLVTNLAKSMAVHVNGKEKAGLEARLFQLDLGSKISLRNGRPVLRPSGQRRSRHLLPDRTSER